MAKPVVPHLLESGEVSPARGDAVGGWRGQQPGQHVPQVPRCVRHEPEPHHTVELGSGITERNAVRGGDDVGNVGVPVGSADEVLGTCRVSDAQQGAQRVRDRPAQPDYLVGLVLDVPRKVRRCRELGRRNADQGVGLIGSTPTNIKVPGAPKTCPVADSDHPARLRDTGDRGLVEHLVRVEHDGGSRRPSQALAQLRSDPGLHGRTPTESTGQARRLDSSVA